MLSDTIQLFLFPFFIYIILDLPFARIRRIIGLSKGEAVFGCENGKTEDCLKGSADMNQKGGFGE